MAVIFLLGPSLVKGTPAGRIHLDVRRRIAAIWTRDGHTVILMEEAPGVTGETILQKFDRLLRQGLTDVVVYWPPVARMATTYTEMVLLCDREGFLKQRQIRVWLLHHRSVASIRGEEFDVLEEGDRSRYLEAVVRLGPRVVEWETEADLDEKIRLLSAEF